MKTLVVAILMVVMAGCLDSTQTSGPAPDLSNAAPAAASAESAPDWLEAQYELKIAGHVGPLWDGPASCFVELCASAPDETYHDACKRACLALCSGGGC